MKYAPKAAIVPNQQNKENKTTTKSGSRRAVSLGTMFSPNQTSSVYVPAPAQHDPLAELTGYLSLPQEDLEYNILD